MPGIYVHIPFCVSKCRYCDFVSFTDREDVQESYMTALVAEAEMRGRELKDYVFDTVYIGGGTPSCVDASYMGMVILAIKRFFNVSDGAEITIEMNPGTVTEEKIGVYKRCGVNRFSVGLQAAQQTHLDNLGRIHTAGDFEECAALLRGENFSADIMIGLKNQSARDVEESIELAAGCGASHISMYALTPEDGTPMYSDYLNGDLPDGDETAALYDAGYKKLKSLGFCRYEVSNFAKEGKESRHNMNYWKRGEYIGLGVAASSHIKDVRFTNTGDIDEYMELVMSGRPASDGGEKIEGQDRKDEFIMLALRTSAGINVREYEDIFGGDFFGEYGPGIEACRECLDIGEGRVRIKDEYLFVQNSIIIEFLGL